jgi:hypothetical protein
MRDHRIRAIGIATLAVGLLAITGCAHGNSADKAASSAQPSTRAPGGTSSDGAPTKGATPPGVDLAVAKRPASDRQVISTAQLDLLSRDIDGAVGRATTVVAENGGYVFAESSSLTRAQHAHVVYKVPPANFDRVLDRIAKLGLLVHRRIGTEDVTGRVVDLGARLGAARTSAERLRELLADSGGVGDLLNVETQLTTRESQVESLAAELAALRAQVDMATVTVDVGPQTKAAVAAAAREQPGFQRGLRAGTAAFAGTARVVEAAVGILLPFLPAVLVAGLGWWLVRRRGAAKAAAS